MLILLDNILRSAENVKGLSRALMSLDFLHAFKIFKSFITVWVGNAFISTHVFLQKYLLRILISIAYGT